MVIGYSRNRLVRSWTCLECEACGFRWRGGHSVDRYLLDRLLRDSPDRRTDQYGGSIENRASLNVERTEATVQIWGVDRVGIGLSAVTANAGNTPPNSNVMALHGYLIRQLNRFTLAYLHFVGGATGTSREVPAGVEWMR